MNLYAKNGGGIWTSGHSGGNTFNPTRPGLYDVANGKYSAVNLAETADNNTAVNFAFQYRPCFFDRINFWGQYTHGWNEGWIKDQNSDVVSGGFGLKLTDQLTYFAQGDWMRVNNDQGNLWHKANGWGVYTGLTYVLPYGVNLEAGYRHEVIDYKDRAGFKHTKTKADTVYAHLGFSF
jgi:hypothetical protein